MINDGEHVTLFGELIQVKELAKKLKNQTRESYEALLEKIVSGYDKGVSVLRSLENLDLSTGLLFESSQSPVANSLTSEFSNKNKHVYKKRKTLPRWSEQVRVCSGTGLGLLDDGYSWRKYGQKDILGAKFPRAYYRCTHRYAQACLAIKQVQRCDEDSTIFEVTYRRRHSCILAPNVEKAISKPMVQQIGNSASMKMEIMMTYGEQETLIGEFYEALLEKIISSFESVLRPLEIDLLTNFAGIDSSQSPVTNSLTSDFPDQVFKDQQQYQNKHVFMKSLLDLEMSLDIQDGNQEIINLDVQDGNHNYSEQVQLIDFDLNMRLEEVKNVSESSSYSVNNYTAVRQKPSVSGMSISSNDSDFSCLNAFTRILRHGARLSLKGRLYFSLSHAQSKYHVNKDE